MKKKTEWLHEKSVPCRYTHVTCQNAKKKRKKKEKKGSFTSTHQDFPFFQSEI